jgi:cytochrome c biogenesis protein CcmG, thiol:disulfide interchange protein DsbE
MSGHVQSKARSCRRIAPLLGLLVVVATTACEESGSRGAKSPEGDEHPLVGVAAPDFELPAQHGARRVSLQRGAGKVRIVDFWATWCEPCKESFPAYQKLAEKHAGKLLIIGISEDDAPEGITAFAKDTGVRFPLAWDEGQTVSKQYQPPTMPTSYVIDASGIVRFVHAGFHTGDEDKIESMIESASN